MKSNKNLSPENFYDKMAPYYDCHIELTRFPLLSPTEEKEFLESFFSNCKTILDLGCGTGRTMKLIGNDNRRIIGVDISNEMIKIAKASGLCAVNTSYFNLPFDSSYFDAIYSLHMGFGYCRSEHEMNMLSKELFRVLRTKGIILLDTPHAKTKGKEYVTSWVAGNELISSISYGKTKGEILKVLADVGFVNISFYGFYKTDCQLEDSSRRIIAVAT
ncbi:MAG: class I SAM-dependent methyltransferase [Deltaproteobacteria bacterium]|nr:class I SAM-dependent methyltransferase [Deltaproteobacteria bacterium]